MPSSAFTGQRLPGYTRPQEVGADLAEGLTSSGGEPGLPAGRARPPATAGCSKAPEHRPAACRARGASGQGQAGRGESSWGRDEEWFRASARGVRLRPAQMGRPKSVKAGPRRGCPRWAQHLLAQPAGAEAQRDHAHREQRQGAGGFGDAHHPCKSRRGRGQGGEDETGFHREKVKGPTVTSSCGAKCPSRPPTGKNETNPSKSSVLLQFYGIRSGRPSV